MLGFLRSMAAVPLRRFGLVLTLVLVGCSGTPASVPPTSAPPTSIPPTSIPPTSIPPTSIPPTSIPPTSAPPTSVSPTPAPPASLPTPAAPVAAPSVMAGLPEAILFLREGALVGLDPANGSETLIAEGVSDFTASADGRFLAFVLREGNNSSLVLHDRQTRLELRLTGDETIASAPQFSPDGFSIAYVVSPTAPPRPADWLSWAAWCQSSEVRVVDWVDNAIRAIGAGCDPAVSPDGRRLIFAAAPQGSDLFSTTNSLRMVNRLGQNGWDFSVAGLFTPREGLAVYAPAFSPSGTEVIFQRHIGYRALTEIGYTEIAGSFRGGGDLLDLGLGWMGAPRFSPDGRLVAVSSYNFDDARGLSGYDVWQTVLLQPGVAGEVFSPEGTLATQGQVVSTLERAAAAAWSPRGDELAVLLPAGWREGIGLDEAPFSVEGPAELRRWQPNGSLSAPLLSGIDYASPLLWVVGSPQIATGGGGYRLHFPPDWQLEPPSQFEELTARALNGRAVISAVPFAGASLERGVAESFPALVQTVTDLSDPVALPDGSRYWRFAGTAPDSSAIAGAMRVSTAENGEVIARLIAIPSEAWLSFQAAALGYISAD